MKSNHQNSIILKSLFSLILLTCFACKKESHKTIPSSEKFTALNALPRFAKSPSNNLPSKEKTDLGRLLFFDPILSGDKDVACATCHHPKNGYAEFRDLSIGPNGTGFGSKRIFKTPNSIPFVKRNAHTIINTAFNGIDRQNNYSPSDAPMFWDSRVNSLEKQAIEPIKALEEMRGTNYSEEDILEDIVIRLKAIPEYQNQFKAVFNEDKAINIDNIGKAIAAYERTLISTNARFDKYMRGNEGAISIAEKEGFELFKKVGCVNCHNGPMFSDYKIHVLSVPDNNKLTHLDDGFEKQFGFRTPTLRNLRFTAPYMHNGMLPNLEKVLEFYEDLSFNKSRNLNIKTNEIDSLAKKLTVKVKDMTLIISFLNTLNDASFDKTVPDNVPSGLMVGGNIQ